MSPRSSRAATTSALVRAAAAARAGSYSPYSRFAVGAAIRTADGRVFTGANVENASYGLAICAERSAACAAVNAGARVFVEAAVAVGDCPPAGPCGMCRQTFAEFGADDMPITIVNGAGERATYLLGHFLPLAFRGDDLKQPEPRAARKAPAKQRK